MPVKIKPSQKIYNRDSKGKMLDSYTWTHYTPSGTSTEELKKLYKDDKFRKKKNIIKKELLKRNEII